MNQALRVSALSPDLRRVRTPEGATLAAPDGWALLPPGDPGLTRRVKAAGPSWTVVEKRGHKVFSKGVWAPAAHIEQAKSELAVERADPKYAQRLEAAARRRDAIQAAYVEDFEKEVRVFLRFAPSFAEASQKLAHLVTLHATPVGSGTVARTERIPVAQRAESAVIAWLRHQTTAYDSMHIARVRGRRRQVRRELAEISRALLDLHRRDEPHAPSACPLCTALARAPVASSSRPSSQRR
jgi:hypothetical protein